VTMKKLLLVLLGLLTTSTLVLAQTGSSKTISALETEINTLWPTTGAGAITATNARQTLQDIVNSYSPYAGTATALSVVNGGTGDSGTAWTGFSPSISCGSGALISATATGRYKTLGKTVFITYIASIISPGSCAYGIFFSTPVTNNSITIASLAGREDSVNGKELVAVSNLGTAIFQTYNYDDTTPIATGSVLSISGVYESQ